MPLKISSGKRLPYCLGLNVLAYGERKWMANEKFRIFINIPLGFVLTSSLDNRSALVRVIWLRTHKPLSEPKLTQFKEACIHTYALPGLSVSTHHLQFQSILSANSITGATLNIGTRWPSVCPTPARYSWILALLHGLSTLEPNLAGL